MKKTYTTKIYGKEKHKRNSKLSTKKNINTLHEKQKSIHEKKRIRMEHNIIQHKKKKNPPEKIKQTFFYLIQLIHPFQTELSISKIYII